MATSSPFFDQIGDCWSTPPTPDNPPPGSSSPAGAIVAGQHPMAPDRISQRRPTPSPSPINQLCRAEHNRFPVLVDPPVEHVAGQSILRADLLRLSIISMPVENHLHVGLCISMPVVHHRAELRCRV
ncbi:hypothetical protein Dimus_021194, partial [Dionaea muscipula]